MQWQCGCSLCSHCAHCACVAGRVVAGGVLPGAGAAVPGPGGRLPGRLLRPLPHRALPAGGLLLRALVALSQGKGLQAGRGEQQGGPPHEGISGGMLQPTRVGKGRAVRSCRCTRLQSLLISSPPPNWEGTQRPQPVRKSYCHVNPAKRVSCIQFSTCSVIV